jgi:hypothetical protein
MWWAIDEVGKVRKSNLMLLQELMSMGEIENLRKFVM